MTWGWSVAGSIFGQNVPTVASSGGPLSRHWTGAPTASVRTASAHPSRSHSRLVGRLDIKEVDSMTTLGETLEATVISSLGNEECTHCIVVWQQPNGALRLSMLPDANRGIDNFAEFLASLTYYLMNPDEATKEAIDLTGPSHSRKLSRSERRRIERLNQKMEGRNS